MRAPIILAIFGLLTSPPLLAQTPLQIEPAAEVAPPAPPQLVTLKHETPVHLMVLNEVSTKSAKPGDRFTLLVREPVIVDGLVVIAENAKAYGEVIEAKESGAVGKSGRLSARLLHVDGKYGPINITGTSGSEGPGGATQAVLGIIGLGVLGLFARGTNAKLKAGQSLTGYIANDVRLPR